MKPQNYRISAAVEFWLKLLRASLSRTPTPFYLFSIEPIRAAIAELERYFGHLPIRHWLSCKTQPLRPLLRWWREQDRPIEVVSEFELQAALAEGFPPERILVNGPAKHRWLPCHAARGLLVNLDSVAETEALAPLARRRAWTVGVRLNTREEFDPEAPDRPTQFGLTMEELRRAMKVLRRHGIAPQIAQFHLRTNVSEAAIYERALDHAVDMCRAVRFEPRYVDCGGGFPPPHVFTREGRRLDERFQLKDLAPVYERALRQFPSAKEVWLENGRWLSARSGALVVKILDVKERRGMRHLICDGGRTLNALVSNWESHDVISVPQRAGPRVPTTVTGPTCMAFDQLARQRLPRSLRAGDHLMWLDAGAYHLSWETRFSHGLAAVLWHEGETLKSVRAPETFQQWWGQWR